MDIRDLAGLSEPLKRLIEVFAEGAGAIARPFLIRKNADARAHEIRVISAALKDATDSQRLPAIFKGGEIEIGAGVADFAQLLNEPDESVRAANRARLLEQKRQQNVEQITAAAAEELAKESDVPDERPDEDWVARFFRAAEDISSAQMRALWGRILAGEIKQPGSFSLRTLDFIRALTSADAELLERLAKLAVYHGGSVCVPTHDEDMLKEHYSVLPMTQFAAAEVGAMYPTALQMRVFNRAETSIELFYSGSLLLLVERGAPGEIRLPMWKFTKVGEELLKLIPPSGDEALLRSLGEFFEKRGAAKVQLASIVQHEADGSITYKNVRTLQP